MSTTQPMVGLAKALHEAQRRRLLYYEPHPKQVEFHAGGADHSERMLLAGNRCGKSWACGMEASMHSTGIYPGWWEGKRFDGPTLGWACGTSNETTRDIVQKTLLGELSEVGTGTLPRSNIRKVVKARGIADAVDRITIKHISGGISTIQFKAYEQGWEAFVGAEIDWVWTDEEPPAKVYSECLARTTNTRGIVFCSLTPLMGMTEVVGHFHPEPDTEDRHLTMMTIEDALHFDDEMRRKTVAKYKPHEREARIKGIPMLGSGRILPVADSVFVTEPFSPPDEWAYLIGMDFGWDHPTAAVDVAWDRDADCLHVMREYRVSEEIPIVHAAALRAWGDWKPVAWPHDGYQHDKISGQVISEEYAAQGLRMHFEHSTFESGGFGIEAVNTELLDRMRTGRLKVWSSCTMLIDEIHVYHRKEGKVVRERDDLISAVHKAVMMKRIARQRRRRVFHKRSEDWNPLEAA